MFLLKQPIIEKIEDIIYDEVKLKMEGKDIHLIINETQNECKAILSQERQKIKMALKEYSKLAYNKTQEAFRLAIATSNLNGYSIEIVDPTTKRPVIFVVPREVLKQSVELAMARLFENRIEFQGMAFESRLAFAKDASNRYFSKTLKESIKKNYEYKFADNRLVSIVDQIKDDWYYLSDDQNVSRIDTVVFSVYRVDHWKKTLEDVNGRPQGRCFTQSNFDFWGLKFLKIDDLKKVK